MNSQLQALLVSSVFSAATTVLSASAFAEDARLYQYSTIDALLAGAYEGDMSVGELAKHGNFGLGTYNRVDGEMVLIDGVFYKVKGNGKIETVTKNELTPLAIVTNFSPKLHFFVANAPSLGELEAALDKRLENKNAFYAIRIRGNFDELTTRAIDPQNKPYKPLAEVVKTQHVFHIGKTEGELIAFRSPGFVKGFNVPGYHWHYLSNDRLSGGHVLSLNMSRGDVGVTPISTVELQVPTNEGFTSSDQTKDRSQELHSVEKIRN